MSETTSAALRPALTGMMRLGGVAVAALVALLVLVAAFAPVDARQGVIYKILFVHAPCAFVAYLGFGLTALAGGLYLWKRDERFDRLAAASAEVGVLFCTLVVVTGPIWALGTWGRNWEWFKDLRLTLTLILWLIYLAYLLLRSFTEGSERAARFSAVFGMTGLVVIPLNYFAIEIAGGRTLHPSNLERGSLGPGMGLPFALGMLTLLATFVYLLWLRLRVGGMRAQLARQAALSEDSLEETPA